MSNSIVQTLRRVDPAILKRSRELRRNMTPQERKLWQRLRSRQFHNIKFRRQHPIHRFILDFFCYEHKLAIEIDGHSHTKPVQQEYDQARTEWLAQHGIRVLRFTNRDVGANIEGVLHEIERWCGIEEDQPPSNSPRRGENRPTTNSPCRGENRPPTSSPYRGKNQPHTNFPQREKPTSPLCGGMATQRSLNYTRHPTSPPVGGGMRGGNKEN